MLPPFVFIIKGGAASRSRIIFNSEDLCYTQNKNAADSEEYMGKRVFVIVLDSLGVGEAPDAARYHDEGSNTFLTVSKSSKCQVPNLKKMGLYSINETSVFEEEVVPIGAYGKMREASAGKDTTTGHWELAGIISKLPMPVYPNGFPKETIEAFEERTRRRVICNQPYSGTAVIKDYGKEHMETGALIVYTSADSVFQVAAHEEVIPIQELYRYCKIARNILVGRHQVGRVIARPFIGVYPEFERTSRRHDYSVVPPADTMLDIIKRSGMEVLSVGKIIDIFAEKGITEYVRTESNRDGLLKLLPLMEQDFTGLCFVNLVDFDMKYGHRNDVDGYAQALSGFDQYLPEIFGRMQEEDILLITADHGCDPGTASTDHSREYVPILLYGEKVKEHYNLGIRNTFADVAQTVLDYLGISAHTEGTSMWPEVKKE